MALVTRKTLLILTAPYVVLVLAIGGFIWSGFYTVAANDPHTGPVYAVLEQLQRDVHGLPACTGHVQHRGHLTLLQPEASHREMQQMPLMVPPDVKGFGCIG